MERSKFLLGLVFSLFGAVLASNFFQEAIDFTDGDYFCVATDNCTECLSQSPCTFCYIYGQWNCTVACDGRENRSEASECSALLRPGAPTISNIALIVDGYRLTLSFGDPKPVNITRIDVFFTVFTTLGLGPYKADSGGKTISNPDEIASIMSSKTVDMMVSDGIDRNKRYTFTASLQNSAGASPQSSGSVAAQPIPPEENSSSGTTFPFWVIPLGVGGMLLLLFVIIVLGIFVLAFIAFIISHIVGATSVGSTAGADHLRKLHHQHQELVEEEDQIMGADDIIELEDI